MHPVHLGAQLLPAWQRMGYRTACVDLYQQPWTAGRLGQANRDDILFTDRGGHASTEVLATFPGRKVYYSPEALEVPGYPEAHTRQRTDEVAKAAAYFDLVIAHQEHAVTALQARGLKNVAPHPVRIGVDQDRFYAMKGKRDYDVVFVGSKSPHRVNFLKELYDDHGIAVMWPEVWGPGMREAFSRAKVVLNLHFCNSPNVEQRIAEAGFCGACVITEALCQGQDPYTLAINILDFSSVKECADKILEILRDSSYRYELSRALNRTVNEHMTIDIMAADLLATVHGCS